MTQNTNKIYPKIIYVLGFIFDSNEKSVVLIEKQSPEWQRGKLNGIGGKYELSDEHPINAMIREAKEEAGVSTNTNDWTQFAELSGSDFIVYCYRLTDSKIFDLAKSKTSEKICKIQISNLDCYKYISNLTWLIPLALDNKQYYFIPYAKIEYNKPETKKLIKI